MNSIEQVQRLRAFELGKAMPLATVRHAHLSSVPMVVLAYHLAGDLGAALGFLVGTDRDAPSLIAVPEPRNRDLRFASLVKLEGMMRPYWDTFETIRYVPRRTRGGAVVEDPIADDAPQLIFANSPTANWFCGLLGRALRYLPTSGDRAVDSAIPALGRDLSFFSDRRAVAGQAVALVATEFTPLHWATGQTPLEDQNVHTLAAWVATEAVASRLGTPPKVVGLLSLVEDLPAAGPVPEPTWDADVFAPLVDDFNAARRAGLPADATVADVESAVRDALTPAWHATWELLDKLRSLPAGAHVDERWAADRRAWGYHLHRSRNDRAWFRRIPTPVQAARLLGESEASMTRVVREMALDDPLAAAAAVVAGEAIEGEIVGVNLSNRAPGPSGRTLVKRPLFRLRSADHCDLPAGTELQWSDRPALTVKVDSVGADGTEVTLVAIAGHGGSGWPGQFPTPGSRAVFGPWPATEFYPSKLPREVPWTHQARPSGVETQ
jgi:hypothetical protein